jgi:hypothetical protein
MVPQLVDALELERVVGKSAPRFAPVHHFADERKIAGRHFGHLGLEPFQVLGCERPVDLKVVVEPVLDGRAKTDPRVGEELAHRGRQNVGG